MVRLMVRFQTLLSTATLRLYTLGRSVGLAALGLTVGALVGGVVEGWLQVDLVPLGALSSPSAVVSEFGLAGMFAATALLY